MCNRLVQNVALEMGYNATAISEEALQDMGVMAMSWANDLATVEAAWNLDASGNDAGLKGDHCSGFVRVLPGNEDVYFSHDTWSGFESMMRIYKLYDFPYVVFVAYWYWCPLLPCGGCGCKLCWWRLRVLHGV